MSDTTKMLDDLDLQFKLLQKQYFQLHDHLNKYAGKAFKDFCDSEQKEIIDLGEQIVATYQEMHPILYFIGLNHASAVNLATGFENWLKATHVDEPEGAA